MSLVGIYLGVVEKVGDPEKLGRLKVRVPAVYGVQGGTVGAVPVDDLPWALPMGLPAGGSNDSGGFSMLPELGDQVAIQFLDGEPEKPVWQWLMQTQNQAKTLKLHQYTAKQEGGQSVAGTAARTILTRYGNSLEIRPDQVTLTTEEGQQVLLQQSTSATGGVAALQTPKGQWLRLLDITETVVLQALKMLALSGKKITLNAPTSALIKTERFTLMAGTSLITVQGSKITVTTQSGATLTLDESGNFSLSSPGGAAISLEDSKIQLGTTDGSGVVIENGKLSINATQLTINGASCSIGTGVSYPVVVLTPQALVWFLTHTHSNGNNGSPTGSPILPFPEDAASTHLQTS